MHPDQLKSVKRGAAILDAVNPGITVAALLNSNIPEVRPLCAPWIYEGVTLLVGPPKSGKTTLARQLAEAVGIGGEFLKSKSESGRTTILSLEEGPRLFRKKLQVMRIDPAATGFIDVYFGWSPGLLGCTELEAHLRKSPNTRLVIIDSLSRFRRLADKNTTAFQADYDAVAELSAVAKLFPGVAIVVIHHTRKMRSADALDDVSGTYGLTAAADAILVLRKEGAGGKLSARGRLWDQDEDEFEMTRSNQRWHMVGASDGMTDAERHTYGHSQR